MSHVVTVQTRVHDPAAVAAALAGMAGTGPLPRAGHRGPPLQRRGHGSRYPAKPGWALPRCH